MDALREAVEHLTQKTAELERKLERLEREVAEYDPSRGALAASPSDEILCPLDTCINGGIAYGELCRICEGVGRITI